MSELVVVPISVSFLPEGGVLRLMAGRGSDFMRRVLGRAMEELAQRGNDADASVLWNMLHGPGAAEARATGNRPSGFRDPPRPLVFRAESLEGTEISPSAAGSFRIFSFYPALAVGEVIKRAFDILALTGIGHQRVRLRDVSVTTGAPRRLSLAPVPGVSRMQVRFVTPTELKSGGATLRQPEFPVLAARARDRVYGLISRFQSTEGGSAAPKPDQLRRLADAALPVRCVRWTIRSVVPVQVVSRDANRTYALHGFMGEAEYEGELSELAPILKACEWTGVGRQTVWGHGAIEVSWPVGPAAE